MKKIGIAAVALVVAITGAGAAFANFGPGCPPDGERDGGKHLKKMAKVLKLTEAQKGKVTAICDAERERMKPVAEKMRENQKLLMAAGEGTSFDETAVRGIAAAQAQLKTEMCVSRIKMQTQINAVLTPEQLELAKDLKPERGHRKGHGRGGCCD